MLGIERDRPSDIFHLIPDAMDTLDERARVNVRRRHMRHGDLSLMCERPSCELDDRTVRGEPWVLTCNSMAHGVRRIAYEKLIARDFHFTAHPTIDSTARRTSRD